MRAQVKDAMRARQAVSYVSCSEAVRAAMGADVMRSVKGLLPDVLAHLHVHVYQACTAACHADPHIDECRRSLQIFLRNATDARRTCMCTCARYVLRLPWTLVRVCVTYQKRHMGPGKNAIVHCT